MVNKYYKEIRNPGIAAVLSFFIPGLGHLYNGEILFGIIISIVYYSSSLFFLFFFPYLIIISIIFWGWLIVDAYNDANYINLWGTGDKNQIKKRQREYLLKERVQIKQFIANPAKFGGYANFKRMLDEKFGKIDGDILEDLIEELNEGRV